MPEPEPELEPEPEPEPELEPELGAELVDGGGLEGLGAGVLAVVEPPAVPDPLWGGLAGTTPSSAFAGLEDWPLPPLHLPPAQIAAQSSDLNVPAGYKLGSLKSARFRWSTSARSRLC